MNRWLAALGNAIEASITGTASIRGTSGSNSPSISSLISVDDLGLRKLSGSSNPGVGIGLGFPSPIEKDSPSGGFPGLRGWGNDLSRKVSLKSRGRGGRPVSHQPSPSESATPMFFDPVHDIRGPPLQHPAPPNKKAHHRSKSFLPTSSMGGPTLNFISPSPVHTSTHFSVPEHLLPPLDSQTRLSFESSSSDRPSNRPSGSSGSGFLRDDFDHHIDRFVTELAASSSPDLSLASPLEAYDRRTASEGSTRDATPRPARPTTIREIAQRPENSSCVDCRRPHPKWATISLNGESVVGFMCIECSGVHRSLGSHVSKVRSECLSGWLFEVFDESLLTSSSNLDLRCRPRQLEGERHHRRLRNRQRLHKLDLGRATAPRRRALKVRLPSACQTFLSRCSTDDWLPSFRAVPRSSSLANTFRSCGARDCPPYTPPLHLGPSDPSSWNPNNRITLSDSPNTPYPLSLYLIVRL